MSDARSNKILVVGNANVEITVPIDDFPLDYEPVRYLGEGDGIGQSVSAVGYNVARMLARLGREVALLAVVGHDLAAAQIRAAVTGLGIDPAGLLPLAERSAQSVVLYDRTGRRQIHTDLQPVLAEQVPSDLFLEMARPCSHLVLTNISYGRALLPQAAALGKTIITDVQALADLEDPYNRPFLETADWLFVSGERLPRPRPDWLAACCRRFAPTLLVMGDGADGAWLARDGGQTIDHVPAPPIEAVKNTGGAGDALCGAFVHEMIATSDPLLALQRAVQFASETVRHAASAAS